MTDYQARLAASFGKLAKFAVTRIGEAIEQGVQSLEQAVDQLVEEGSTGQTTKKPTKPSGTTKASGTKRSSSKAVRGGRTPISTEKQSKIREGFAKGMTTKEIAEFAGVSQSSAIRYTAPLR